MEKQKGWIFISLVEIYGHTHTHTLEQRLNDICIIQKWKNGKCIILLVYEVELCIRKPEGIRILLFRELFVVKIKEEQPK